MDWSLADCSVPSGCPDALNLYVPNPTAVVPNPTILDLTSIGLDSVFSKDSERIPELIFALKVPIKLSEISLLVSLSK